MKHFSEFLSASLLIGVFTVQSSISQSPLQSGKLIPVYPGAILKTDFEPEDSKMCCSFVSDAGFEKVISFYETSLGMKSLDVNGLASQLPFLKQQTDMMLQQMPAGMKIRFFVLKVVEFQGQKGAELFEVYTGPTGVEFNLMESQLNIGDQHFAAEWIGEAELGSGSGGADFVDTKVLITALPSSGPEGYVKGELNTDQTPGSPPYADISYRKLKKKGSGGEEGAEDKYYVISISISDNAGSEEFADEMVKAERDIDKAVMVNGKYKGVESIEKNEFGCVEASKRFVVNKRFLVELHGSEMCDMAMIDKLIAKMNLDVLPK